MAHRQFIGIDSGTQGTKAVVFDEAANAIIAQSYRGYTLMENGRGGREQCPQSWIDACDAVLQEVLAQPRVERLSVRGIGVSGQQHGLVPLDAAGEVIRPAKLWCDTETVPQCETLTRRAGGQAAVLNAIGNRIAPGFTASKLLWLLENEPENYERLATVLLPHDYINFWLTGMRKTECGDASGTAYFDVVNRRWSPQLLDAIDSSGRLNSCLPELIQSHEAVGRLSQQRAEELGLSADVRVAAGGGDNMMAAIGTGNVSAGVVTASLGTSGTIYAHSETPVTDKEGELAAFCSSDGGWLPLVCTMNVTVATEAVRGLVGLSLEEMNLGIMQTAPGAEGLLLLPYFNGERTPALPSASATLTGMNSLNLRPELVCRAAMEGATFGLRYGLDVLQRNGIAAKEIRVVGGGAKSEPWRQTVADIFNCEIVCLKQEEAAATGAALQALWCVACEGGADVSLEAIVRDAVQLDEESRHIPDQKNVAFYSDRYEAYLRLCEAVRPLYPDQG